MPITTMITPTMTMITTTIMTIITTRPIPMPITRMARKAHARRNPDPGFHLSINTPAGGTRRRRKMQGLSCAPLREKPIGDL
jgi:hypothetical protein